MRHVPHRLATALLLALPLAACNSSAKSDAEAKTPAAAQAAPARQPAQTLTSAKGQIRVTQVARGLAHPWSLAFLPDGSMLVTERGGALRRVGTDGAVSAPITGVPKVFATGQGGLLDVVLAPDFANTQRIYLSYAEPGDNGTAGTAVAYGTLAGDALADVKVIYRQEPKVDGPNHFGSRLVFDGKGHLFISQGERNKRAMSQELDKLQGKLVRLNLDGSVPQDNPFVGKAGALPEIWSYGHRNGQGATWGPDGQLWMHEHGAQGGDEINLPQPGRNYGWPQISHGVNYGGSPVGTGKSAAPGMEQPLHHWTPSIAPSGMAFLTSDRYGPAWQGNLFVGSLKFQYLNRIELKDGKVVAEHKLLEDVGQRMRDVRQGPDGLLYVVTDSPNGRLIRVLPL